MNKEQQVAAAKAIALVRRTGKVNMFDRPGVVGVLKRLGFEGVALHVKGNRDTYLELLEMSGKY